MKYIALSLFIILISLNIFSFAIFGNEMNHKEGGCVASFVDRNECPLNIIDFAIHKITAIKTFSITLISSDVVLPVIFNIITFSFLLFLLYKIIEFFKLRFLSQKQRELSLSFYKIKLITNNWLSLLENSPVI